MVTSLGVVRGGQASRANVADPSRRTPVLENRMPGPVRVVRGTRRSCHALVDPDARSIGRTGPE
jgi:hypothetical protein